MILSKLKFNLNFSYLLFLILLLSCGYNYNRDLKTDKLIPDTYQLYMFNPKSSTKLVAIAVDTTTNKVFEVHTWGNKTIMYPAIKIKNETKL